MLHIASGVTVADRLTQSGLEGRVLTWKEDYTEGPVSVDMTLESVRRERASFLHALVGIPPLEYEAVCQAQEAALLQAAAAGEEIVLWFGHDLFDQTMLAYLLHRLDSLELPQRINPQLRQLQAVCAGSHPGGEPLQSLSQLDARQLAQLCPQRRPVAAAALSLGSAAWQAYASTDPRSLEALLHTDTTALPFLGAALISHLQRFPSVGDGLGIVERAALQIISAGTHHLMPIFREVAVKLPQFGLTQLPFWICLGRLMTGSRPLIRLNGGNRLPRYGDAAPSPCVTVRLTPDGQDILEGRSDCVMINGIDRILGGGRLLRQDPVWRWDPASAKLLRGKAVSMP